MSPVYLLDPPTAPVVTPPLPSQSAPVPRPDDHDVLGDGPRIAELERGLNSALLGDSPDAFAAAALALADGLALTPRAGERPALLRLAALRGGPPIRGRALLRLGAALAERGADSQARAAWSAAAQHPDPAVAAAAELELALADLAAGHNRRAQRSLRRLATDQRDPDIAIMAASTLRGAAR